MSAATLRSYVTYSFTDKVDPLKTDGVTADDVISPLVKILAPDSFTDSKEQFLKEVASEEETGFSKNAHISWLLLQVLEHDERYRIRSRTHKGLNFHSARPLD